MAWGECLSVVHPTLGGFGLSEKGVVRTAAAAGQGGGSLPPNPEAPMTRTTLTAAATLALALIASAPAMAGCRSTMVTEVYGSGGCCCPLKTGQGLLG